MRSGADKRLLFVWLVLSAITLSQLGVGSLDHDHALSPDALITASAVLIALLKVRIVMREFMEVRHAPARLRRWTDAWVILTGLVLLGAYFVGTAVAG